MLGDSSVREDDVTYFQRRGETEVECAQRASASRAVQAHHRLAEAYLEKVAAVDTIKERRP